MSGSPDRTRIADMVRRSLERLQSGGAAAVPTPQAVSTTSPAGGAITEADLIDVAPGSSFEVPAGRLITPSARELALFRRIQLVENAGPLPGVPAPISHPPSGATAASPSRRVAMGADHGGFAMKELLRPHVLELGFAVEDCGPTTADAVDYPDYAYATAAPVGGGGCSWGIFVDGAGIGSCMVANKVPGVRAAHCYDVSTALNAREHNNANFLTLGGGLTGDNLARQIVKTFLRTPFGGGRHARRVDKIMDVERRFLRGDR